MKNLMLAISVVLAAAIGNRLVRADEADDVKKIQGLVQAQKVGEAEEAFREALKDYPDSDAVQSLHMQLYLAYSRTQKFAEAAEHAVAYLDFQLERLAKDTRFGSGLPNAANMAASALQLSGKPDLAIEKIDKTIAAVDARQRDASVPRLETVLDALRTNKLNMLINMGRAQDAEKLVQAELATAIQAHEGAPDDAAPAARLANLMQFEIAVAARTAPDKTAPLRAKLAEFIAAQLKKHPESAALVTTYNTAAIQAIREVMSSDPAEAEKRLAEWKVFLESLDTSNQGTNNAAQFAKNNMTSLERTLAANRKRQELVGQPAIPLDTQDWINGMPLSDGDLKGKVVLLDFWAVWCGPCIATFPHLREWNEKFTDKGLVIVGITRYYQYDWDEEAKRSKRTSDLSPEDEQAAMLKFAEHHQLKHRFAITPKVSGLYDAYGVTGIPQAVLIDRAGVVRMIRVGSGEQNARDLDKLLEELIGQTSGATGGGR